MKMTIDLKSALCGLVIGITAMFAIGAETSPNQVGRFQSSGGSGFFLIVDTTNGKAWFANVSAQNLTRIDTGFFDAK
jgi:streptogramin lyase